VDPTVIRTGIVTGRGSRGRAKGGKPGPSTCWDDPMFERRFMEALTDRTWEHQR
jgi:hypothetical protein